MHANHRLKSGSPFSGVIYGHQLTLTIGTAVGDLQLVAQTTTAAEFMSQVLFLPL